MLLYNIQYMILRFLICIQYTGKRNAHLPSSTVNIPHIRPQDVGNRTTVGGGIPLMEMLLTYNAAGLLVVAMEHCGTQKPLHFTLWALFPQQRKLMGSSAQISSGVCRCGSEEQVPEEGSGRFRKVPEGSGEFRRVLV